MTRSHLKEYIKNRNMPNLDIDEDLQEQLNACVTKREVVEPSGFYCEGCFTSVKEKPQSYYDDTQGKTIQICSPCYIRISQFMKGELL